MKKVLVLIALAMLIPASLAFVPTQQDSKWGKSLVDNTNIIASDFGLIGSAAENSDFAAVKKYCEYAKTDISIAMEDSKSYTVSNELQNAKDYYEQALNECYIGVTMTISGIDKLDASEIKAATVHMQSGTRYLQLATKELNEVMGV